MPKEKNNNNDQQITPTELTDEVPAKIKEEIKEEILAAVAVYKGPIPPVSEMEGYKLVDSSFPDRILKMAESEQAHRHEMEKNSLSFEEKIANKDFFERRLGQIFALIIAIIMISCGSYLVLKEHPIAGTIFSGTCLVSLVTVFIVGRSMADKEDIQKEDQ